MLTLRDLYLHETLDRLAGGRASRTRAPGDEGPRRSLVRPAARWAGRALIALGARLLAFGRGRAHLRAARGVSDLVPYAPPPSFFQN